MPSFFEETEVLKILQGFNPWWTGHDIVIPGFRRLAYRAIRSYLDNPTLQRAVLLSGPRRVGKTTILRQLAQDLVREQLDPKSILLLSLDHPLLKTLELPGILQIYHHSVYPETKPAVVLLDEIQYSSDWDLHLKQFIDHRPNYRIVATGSASLLQRERLSETGVGRWVTVHIPTLSFYEFLHIREEVPGNIPARLRPSDLFDAAPAELTTLAPLFRPLMPEFRRYLLVGGFPETARQEDIDLSQRLLREDVVERVLKRDMAAFFRVRNVEDLERLFVYICLNSGGILAVQTCAAALGVPNSTVSNYLAALEQANLIYRVESAVLGGKKMLKARHKVYLVDAALRNAVLLRGQDVLENAEEMGGIVETTVLRHLYAYYYRDNPKIVYWRDSTRDKEVDIIVQSPAYTIPVEVKYREDARVTAQDGIALYCAQEKVKRAYLVTRREEDFDFQDFPETGIRILRIPAHILTYLLGQAEMLLWPGVHDDSV